MVAGTNFFLICICILLSIEDACVVTYPIPIPLDRLGDMVPEVTCPIVFPCVSNME